MRLLTLLSFFLLTGTAPAGDLFVDEKLGPIKKGDLVMPDTTIGGYPFYHGEAPWKFFEGGARETTSTIPGRAGPPLGWVDLRVNVNDKVVARQHLVLNLQGNQIRGWSDEPCDNDALVTRNLGGGYRDRCMSIIAGEDNSRLYLSVFIFVAADKGRYYRSTITLDPELLGRAGQSSLTGSNPKTSGIQKFEH